MSLIPFVIEKTAVGERSYDLFSRMLKERIIFVNGPISTEMSHSIVAQLLFLESEDPKQDIYMYLNSLNLKGFCGIYRPTTERISVILVGLAKPQDCLQQAGHFRPFWR